MRKVMKILSLIALASATTANAVEWGAWAQVHYVYVKTDAGRPFVFFKGASMPGCYQESGGYLYGDSDEKAYSTVLAAFMAGREVRPLYEIVSGGSGWGMCRITSIYMR